MSYISKIRMTKMYTHRYRRDIFVILYRMTSAVIKLEFGYIID